MNTVELTESGGQTTMKMTILYPSKEAREAALKTGMKDGMEKSFDRLEEVVGKLADSSEQPELHGLPWAAEGLAESPTRRP